MSGRRTTTLSCVTEQGNNVSDVGDNGIRVKRETETTYPERRKETQ